MSERLSCNDTEAKQPLADVSSRTCGHESGFHGAGPCPRSAGHDGDHLWWLTFQAGRIWHVIVYSGTASENRRKRARGCFSAEPTVADVRHLLEQLSPLRRRELDRRTPVSEPEPPPYQAVRVEVQRKPGWSQLALATPNEKAGHTQRERTHSRMSWNLNTEGAIPLSEADVAIDELGITGASPEVEEQISAAKAAAKSLLASGAVGNGEDVRVSVGINGHANPDHAYSEGMAQDTISVTVRQTPPVPASPPAEPANEGTTGEQAPADEAGNQQSAPAPGDASDQLATPPAQENVPMGGPAPDGPAPSSEEGSAGVQAFSSLPR